MSENKLTFYNKERKRVGFFPDVIKELVKYFENNSDATLIVGFSNLRMKHKSFKDFSVIKKINPKKLLIQSSPMEDCNVAAFSSLKNLIELDNRDGLNFDFKNSQNLEILRYTWQKKGFNLSECKKLKELSLWSYKPTTKNLTEFSNLISLNELRIIQSNIKSISGIENLQNVSEMVFIANRVLSFEDIHTVFPNVETLYIESCKQVRIEKIIKLFPNIKDLNFFSNNEIASLRIILDNLTKLEKLNVYNLKILENDNRYWKDYKNLRDFNFHDRKHHILKRKDFENV